MLVFLIFIMPCISAMSAIGLSTNDSKKLLNVCLDSRYHKFEPGPEEDLYKQCLPWKDKSCCMYNTTRYAHHTDMYGFTYDHCGEYRKLSEECGRHFMQDLCFYECSPNIGPWIVKDSDMKIRKERFFEVPLCLSDCEAWFVSCSEDYTCTDNWSRNFKWVNGRNHCPEGSTCRTFKDIYGTAENFCRKVWDHSWKPVSDEEPCMRLWFDPVKGNPNERVAQIYATKFINMRSGADFICSKFYLLTLTLMLLSAISLIP